MLFFLNKGYRVIAHDRRGHGRSTQVGEDTISIITPMTLRQ
jgi:alpha-beta hydrolase superfamily lysophospholipase